MEDITGPGTIDQLVADARTRQHEANPRLIRDWTQAGLLDYPTRRPAGKGHGSLPALYAEEQRKLFLTLLHHRPTTRIRGLAKIPVGLWLYFGDSYVPLRQARLAMTTWLGDSRTSLRGARETAQEMLLSLDNPAASEAARRHLRTVISDSAYTGKVDFRELEAATRAVFEPGHHRVRRAVGHPAAPLLVDSVIQSIKARVHAVKKLNAGEISDEQFNLARHTHLVSFADYIVLQPFLAAQAPATNPDMYEPATAEATLNRACGDLLTSLGLVSMFPQRAAEIAKAPIPSFNWAT
ncbi:hypothetical protein KDK95_21370 [Actinospica sp. MGRD01-02]|uniref:Uncharacterized protein n=1 Tax=Actinospica acidithermotolerans TaxID=2828514 RepID=A0A941EJQ8_9ACTN|nr:hypothetical protein [Actinospica acidithermotolerans]MBR7828874.1 hypothetical protein [Actinospica acidithermotolerans]